MASLALSIQQVTFWRHSGFPGWCKKHWRSFSHHDLCLLPWLFLWRIYPWNLQPASSQDKKDTKLWCLHPGFWPSTQKSGFSPYTTCKPALLSQRDTGVFTRGMPWSLELSSQHLWVTQGAQMPQEAGSVVPVDSKAERKTLSLSLWLPARAKRYRDLMLGGRSPHSSTNSQDQATSSLTSTRETVFLLVFPLPLLAPVLVRPD